MAGPSIARASVTVDLDGKNIPAEAKLLGEEAGAAAGDAHNKEFSDRVKQGYGDIRHDVEQEMRETGQLSGKESGANFSEALKNAIRADAQSVTNELANIFSKDNGLDEFRKRLAGVDQDFATVEDTVRGVDRLLQDATDNGSITTDEVKRLVGETDNWAKSLISARDHTGELKGSFGDMDRNYVQSLSRHLSEMFDNHGSLEGYRQELQKVEGSFVPVERVVAEAGRAIDDFGLAGGRGTQHFGTLRKSVDDFAKTAGKDLVTATGDMVRGVEKLGDAAVKDAGKIDNLGQKVGSLVGKLAASAGAGNLAALIALLVGLAGPAAVLLSALAAQTVILGTVAAAGAVGVLGLVLAFGDLHGKSATTRAALQPTITALKDMGTAFGDLRQTFQLAVFKDMGGVFDHLADSLPKLGPGVTAIGTALNSFLRDGVGAITKNIGPINDLLGGFGPIIQDLGDSVIRLAGVFGGLFRAAMPFARDFASSLEDTTKKWSDWINSIAGQKALQKWFADAQPVMDHVMTLLGNTGKAFSNLITPQAAADVLTVLDNIGSLLLSITSIAASLSPATTAATTILALAGEILTTLDPILSGIGVLAEGLVAIITPVVRFLDSILGPVFGVLGNIIATIGNLIGALAPIYVGYFGGMAAAVKPVIAFVTSLYNAFLDFINKGIKIAGPAIQELGTIFQLIGTSLGDLFSGFFGAAKQTTAFGDAAKVSGAVLDGFKGFISDVTGYLKGIASVIQNQVIPAIKEMDWKKVTDGLNTIVSIIPDVIDYFGNMIGAIGKVIAAFGAWQGVVVSAVTDIVGNIRNVGAVIQDVANGNFVQAGIDIKKTFDDASKNSADFKSKLTDALRKTGDAADSLGKAHQKMQHDIEDATLKATKAIDDFKSAGDSNLSALSKRLGLTGTASTDFRALVVDAAKKSGASLKDVAQARDLGDLETKLGLTGTAARTRFANEMIAAMNASKTSIGTVPPEIQKLIDKYGTIPKNKSTKVAVDGVPSAISSIDALISHLGGLKDKTVTATIINKQVNAPGSKGSTAIGGIMAGGQLLAGGITAFADGGILSSPTWFGNVLAGEAGTEAIVPLSRPLNQVDPSVRNLAAYAQGVGMNATTDKQKAGAYVAAGAIVVQTPATDGTVVAEQVLDRLVPRL